ncbi:MAG: hypothetical protein SCM96_10955 [Acidobacteriota bacterium]|nr:hypothetical protein [Acidobacteriota bacterium]
MTFLSVSRWLILCLAAALAGIGILCLEAAGQAESPIQLSGKAMAHLRAPSGNMPDEINREISNVLQRYFGGVVAAVMGSGAETKFNAVTTYGSMFGARDSLMNRLEIDSRAEIPGAGAGEELARLEAAEKNLKRTISLAERRFLLNKDDYEDDLVLIDEVIGALRDILKRSVPSGTEVRPPVDRKPPVQKVDPPVRLRHEEQAETVTFASHSPALKALRFYEAGMEGIADGFRDYRATFPKAASRLIWWKLHFEYPAPGRRIDFSVEAVYTAPDGREIIRKTHAYNFQPEWTGSKHVSGFGYRDRGGWQPGIYRVELFVNGTKITEGKFFIIE